MTGSYNWGLVFASYCVAVIAAYTAIYFGTRLFEQSGSKRSLWLTVGALCLGSGIWSMHFVGMSAYSMPMDMHMSFSAWLTFASWVPAVLASALALYVITLPEAPARSIAASAMIMGAGIFAMHYGGMHAMQMHPAIEYDLLLVIASGVIAVVASGAAMVICRKVREVPVQYALATKVAAALVMGAAICGMHYTGMAAANYPMGAEAASDNALRGDWMGIPTAIAASVFLLLAIFVAYSDFRAAEQAREEKMEKFRHARQAAFFDPITGLPNRSYLETKVLERLTVRDRARPAPEFSLLYFELGRYRELAEQYGVKVAQNLAKAFAAEVQRFLRREDLLVRYSNNSFMVLAMGRLDESAIGNLLQQVEEGVEGNTSIQRMMGSCIWSFGCSEYPKSGSASRNLIRAAQKIREEFGEKLKVVTLQPA